MQQMFCTYVSSLNIKPKYSFSFRLKCDATKSNNSLANNFGCQHKQMTRHYYVRIFFFQKTFLISSAQKTHLVNIDITNNSLPLLLLGWVGWFIKV